MRGEGVVPNLGGAFYQSLFRKYSTCMPVYRMQSHLMSCFVVIASEVAM